MIRREFLKTIGVGAAAFVLNPNTLFAAKPKTKNIQFKTEQLAKTKEKTRFAFLADIHYAHVGALTDAGTSWGLKEDGLVALVDYLKNQNLDFVVLGGDFCNIDFWFTDAAMIEDAHDAFERVKTEFERLNIPIYYLRGNHETYLAKVKGVSDKNHEFCGDKLYRHHCGYGPNKATYYDFDCAGWKFIALDSGGMIGAIEPAQMKWLKSVLKSTNTSTPIVLFIHGPLYPFFGDVPESTKLVTNYKAVIDAFKNHSLKLVYQGHLHNNALKEVIQIDSSGNKKKIPFILSGAPFYAINTPFHPDGGFHIIDIFRKDYVVSSVRALSQSPKVILTTTNSKKNC